MNIQEFLNNTDIERVNRLWADYVSNSNSIVYAKIQQSLKEVGLEPLNTTLTDREKDKMRKKEIEEKFENLHDYLNSLPLNARNAPGETMVDCGKFSPC